MRGDELVLKLGDLLRRRETSKLFNCIRNEDNNRLIRSYPARGRLLRKLIVIIAQAVELGYPNDGILQDLVRKLPRARQKCFEAYVAKGVIAARKGKSCAGRLFSEALSYKSMVSAEDIVFVRHCLGNNSRKPGDDYTGALNELELARRRAESAKLLEIAADVRVDEAWPYFQDNKPQKTTELFDLAEPILRAAGDHRRLGDIASGRGRIEQRGGRLEKAADYFGTSLSEYDRCPVPHRGHLRALINLGKVELLQARQIRLKLHKIQQRVERTTLATYEVSAVSLERIAAFFQRHRGEIISEELQAELEKLCDLDRRQYSRNVSKIDALNQQRARLLNQASLHLDEAKTFYESNPTIVDFLSLARELVSRCYLHIERHDWPSAISAAKAAFDLGLKHASKMVQARAKIVETMAYVQKLWHGPHAAPDQIELALQTGQQAVDLSAGLQARIKIKAHTWNGLAQFCQDPTDLLVARASVDEIEKIIFGMPNDYVTEDADMLKRTCEQLATRVDQDVIRLAEIILNHDENEVPWDTTSKSVRDFRIERLLRRHEYTVDVVRRILTIHPRLIRPIRDRLLNVTGSSQSQESDD